MNVIVIHANRYGSTGGIAEFIAEKLLEQEVQAEARRVNPRPDLGKYDAVVIGSAVYQGRWMKEAAEFVERNREALAARPIWLFGSGPLTLPDGIALDDPQMEPREIVGLRETIRSRDPRVFFGALDPARLEFRSGRCAGCRPSGRSFRKGNSGTGRRSRPGRTASLIR